MMLATNPLRIVSSCLLPVAIRTQRRRFIAKSVAVAKAFASGFLISATLRSHNVKA